MCGAYWEDASRKYLPAAPTCNTSSMSVIATTRDRQCYRKHEPPAVFKHTFQLERIMHAEIDEIAPIKYSYY